MSPKFPKKDMFGYFRMGLVTGLVDKQDLIAWADREILVSAVPEEDLIEEEYLDKELISRLAALDGKLDAYRQGQVTHQYLYECLWGFLIPYNQYRPLLRGLL